MKENKCSCGCILAGRKFLNEDGSVDRKKLAVIYERWFREQLSIGIKDIFAYDVIKSYAKDLCDCKCHKTVLTKKD